MNRKYSVTIQVTHNIFTLDVDGKDVIYTEFLNDKGKVIDFTLRDGDGNEISDPALLEQIQEFTKDM